MNNQFDELTKNIAQSVTRRGALKKFGVGIVAALATALGAGNESAAQKLKGNGYCVVVGGLKQSPYYAGTCLNPTTCQYKPSSVCTGKIRDRGLVENPCAPGGGIYWTELDTNRPCWV